MPSGSEEPQRILRSSVKLWLAVFLVSPCFGWLLLSWPGDIGVKYGSDGTYRFGKTDVSAS